LDSSEKDSGREESKGKAREKTTRKGQKGTELENKKVEEIYDSFTINVELHGNS